MRLGVLTAAVLLSATAIPVHAKPSPHIDRFCDAKYCHLPELRQHRKVKRTVKRVARPVPLRSRTIAAYSGPGRKSTNLGHVTPVLAAKTRELIQHCGAKVVSAHRPRAVIRGTRVPSLHGRWPAEAVDLAGGDIGCVYARLKHWRGGYSTDYRAVRHVHISFSSDGRERGARFVHRGVKKVRMVSRRAVVR